MNNTIKVVKKSRKSRLLVLYRVKYRNVSHMCQTEMCAKLTWGIFGGHKIGNKEELELKKLQKNRQNPIIEYNPSTNIDVSQWQIHLDAQIKKYGLTIAPKPTKSKGTQLADILSSGFKDFVIKNKKQIPNYYIRRSGKPHLKVSRFITNGNKITLAGKV